MRRNRLVALATASLVGAAVLPLTAGSVEAAPAPAAAPGLAAPDANVSYSDDLPAPAWKQKYDAIRQAALEQRLRTGGSGEAEKLSKGVYGRAATTGKEKIFVVLTEFGKKTHSAYPDGEGNATTFDGPKHNAIPKPNRKVDNKSLWKADYDRKHYDNMYFNRMKAYYERESNGKYSIDGAVTEWVKVPFNQARYGRDTDCTSVACSNTWFLVRDGLAYWVDAKLDSGWKMPRIRRYLKTFDELDRYDFDSDGNFKEPDGYIDHFQIVHAGGDAADGDPIYGDDAIWSHRWNAQIEPQGTGPRNGAPIGGVNAGMGGLSDSGGAAVQVPDNPTGVWVNDYTIQPENGGLGVFAHEFAHDLGLPDLYDTSGAENSVEFWSLMAQSRGTLPKDAGIGDRATSMGAWDKFQLGWLDYELATNGFNSTHKIRPNESSDSSAVADGVVVLLPDKKVPSELGAPCAECGDAYYYSDQGDGLNNTMTRDVATGGALTAKVRYEIEDGWDYAFLEASSDGGQTWDGVATSETYEGTDDSGLDPDDVGISGNTAGEWVDLTATVPDSTNALRWRYVTDGAFALPGFQVDNVTLAGEPIGTAEDGDDAWTLDGFRTTTGTEINEFLNAYFVDNRQYVGNDRTLDHLYNFAGYPKKRANKVDFFSYNQGALISYWDTSYSDNNVGDHPGAGEILPVDSHPRIDHAPDGSLLRSRIAGRDSTFSVSKTPRADLHYLGEPISLRGRPGVQLFDDLQDWWYAEDAHSTTEGHPGAKQPGWYSVDVPKTGTTIRVVRVNKAGVMTVRVGSSG